MGAMISIIDPMVILFRSFDDRHNLKTAMSAMNDPPSIPSIPRSSFEQIVNSYQKKNGETLLSPRDIQAKLPLSNLHEFIRRNPTPRDRKALENYFGEELKGLAENLFTSKSSGDYQHVVAYLKAKSDLFEANNVYLLNCLDTERMKMKDLTNKQVSNLGTLERRNTAVINRLESGLVDIAEAKVNFCPFHGNQNCAFDTSWLTSNST